MAKIVSKERVLEYTQEFKVKIVQLTEVEGKTRPVGLVLAGLCGMLEIGGRIDSEILRDFLTLRSPLASKMLTHFIFGFASPYGPPLKKRALSRSCTARLERGSILRAGHIT